MIMKPEMDSVQYSFHNKVILVTGSGGGIGSSIAAAFANAGGAVGVHYRSSRARAEQVVKQIADSGGEAASFQADLSAVQDVQKLVSDVKAHFGRLDILINNAGIFPTSDLMGMEPGQWDAMIDANLRSVYLCTRAAADVMAEQDGGVIINITSIEANQPAAGHAHYSTSKAGVLMFTRASANELGPMGIRVNAVAPGLINREGLEEAWPEGVASYRSASALGTIGEPEDVANACLFLASPAARWITGINLTVDGGISNRPLI